MNILQLCSKVPNPPVDGGTAAMDVLTNGLLKLGATIKVLAISTQKHPFVESKIDKEYKAQTNIESVFIDTRLNPLDAFFNLFSNKSYNVSRFYSNEMNEKLIAVLKGNTFDAIQLEGLYVAPYLNTIRKYSNAKVVLRSHNIEYSIWERTANNTLNPLKKTYIRLLAKRLKSFELEMLNKYDGIACITPEDAKVFKKLGCTKPIISVPFGIDLKSFNKLTSDKPKNLTCFHLGAMNWAPNLEGVKWLLDKVWGKVTSLQPNLKLYLAGRHISKRLKNYQKKNIIIVGEVENQFEFMQSKGIMLVPLLSAGGMRIKIIEGMAIGKTIISTSIGAEGIPHEHNKNILIANTPDEFATCINRCISDSNFYHSIGENARQLVLDHFDNEKICQKLLNFYQEIGHS